jgi:predicted RNase H-like HicB family nuclease
MATAQEMIGLKPVITSISRQKSGITVGQAFCPEDTKTITKMKSIRFKIEESDGYFVATAESHAIITQAKSWPKLLDNIDEAIRLHLQLKRNEKYHLELDLEPAVVSLVRKSAKVQKC